MGHAAPGARPLAAWLLLGCAAAAALQLAGRASAQTAEPAGDTRAGAELYQRWCAVCHGTDGAGTAAGPPIDDVPIAFADLAMRTGYMPLTDRTRGVRERELTDEERQAVLAYMVERFDLDGAVPAPGPGDRGRGQDLYTTHCAQCHGAAGEGGVSGQQATVPATRGREPLLIAEAVRVGPFQMPPFGREQISDAELDDIVAFLQDQPSNSPLGLADLTRVDAFAWGLLLAATMLAVSWWIGKRPVRAPDADLAGDEEGATQP